MSSYVKLKVSEGTGGSYNETDLLLLSRLLSEMSAGSLSMEMDGTEKVALQGRFKQLGRDIGAALFRIGRASREDDEEQEERSEAPQPDMAESWHVAYLNTCRFDLWMKGLPPELCARLSAKQDVVRLACLNLRQFRDLDSGYALDILAPSVLKQKAVADPVVSALLDPAFPAYTDASMLLDGRLIVVPTEYAVEMMSQFGVFRDGTVGMCRLTKGDPRMAEHVRGVRVSMSDLLSVLDRRQNVYDMMFPDLEPDDDPTVDVSDDELEALSRRLPDPWLFGDGMDIGDEPSY